MAPTARQGTDDPFPQALAGLRRDRGLTYRQLAAATRAADPAGKGLSAPFLCRVENGERRVTPTVVAFVAAALGLPESYFAEGRLEEVRRRLDPQTSGLDAALRELHELERLA